jgi:hypothetical protein
VRLPGGKYVRPGFAEWSKLYDVSGQELAHDGKSAARVLLAYQTIGELVPNLAHEELEAFAQELIPVPALPVNRPAPRRKVEAGGPDSRWEAKCRATD